MCCTAWTSAEGWVSEVRSIIREFYLGNLTPCETQTRPSSEMAKVTAVLAETDRSLRSRLDGENLTALERLIAAQTDLVALTAEENYANGFRCGGRFMLDTLIGEGENTMPVIQNEQ